MYVVAGVTGQTGGAVAQELLVRGQAVRALVRSKARAARWAERGVELREVSLDDVHGLRAAFEGARGAYLLVPPANEFDAPNAAACRVVDAYREALEQSPLRHVAMLSSVGAQHEAGTGPILPCHYAERVLVGLKRTRITFLRAAYFMENLRSFLDPVREHGVLPVLFSTDRRVDMVAVSDLARMSVALLMERARKHRVVEAFGPREQTFEQVAASLSVALERPVRAVRVPPDEIVATLQSLGVSRSAAELYREMALGVDSGLVAFERGAVKQVRGATTIEQFVRRFV